MSIRTIYWFLAVGLAMLVMSSMMLAMAASNTVSATSHSTTPGDHAGLFQGPVVPTDRKSL